MNGSRMLDLGRREFLAAHLRDRSGGFPRAAPPCRPPPSPARNDKDPPASMRRAICLAPQYLAEEFLRLEGFTEVEYLPLGTRNGPRRSRRRPRRTSPCGTRLELHPASGRRQADRRARRRSRRLLSKLFGNERVRAIRDLKGKTVADPVLRGRGPHPALEHAGLRGHQPATEVNWITGRGSCATRWICSSRARPTPSSASPSSPQELRAKKVGHVIVDTAAGSALVAVLLLHGRREPGLRAAQPDRDQARAARDPQGRRHLRRRPRARRALSCRTSSTSRAIQIGLEVMKSAAVQPLARGEPGGHAALPRAAAARGRHDQVQPAEAHRAGHGLAVSRTN